MGDTEGMGFMERVRAKAEAKRKALEKKVLEKKSKAKKALLGTGEDEKKKKEADKDDKGGDEDEDDDKWGKVEKAGPWTVEIDDTTGAEYYYNHDTGMAVYDRPDDYVEGAYDPKKGKKKEKKKKKKEKEEFKPSSRDIFGMFDENYDDTLDYDEFVRVIEDLMPGTSQEDIDLHFEEANLAEDGYVTYEEFQEWWANWHHEFKKDCKEE